MPPAVTGAAAAPPAAVLAGLVSALPAAPAAGVEERTSNLRSLVWPPEVSGCAMASCLGWVGKWPRARESIKPITTFLEVI